MTEITKMTIKEWLVVILGILALIYLIPKIVNGQGINKTQVWVKISEPNSDSEWSVLKKGLGVTVDQTFTLPVKLSRDEDTFFILYEFDCYHKQMRVNKIGNTFDTMKSDIGDWYESQPYTISDLLLRTVCSNPRP